MYRLLLLSILYSVFACIYGQNRTICDSLNLLNWKDYTSKADIESLITGNTPKDFENQILTAFKYYPEIKQLNITFKRKKIRTTMACRPYFFSVFRKPSKRKYKIIINDNDKLGNIKLNNFNYNAQIGIIAHELAHIVDFSKKNSLQIISIGLLYPFKSWRSKYEKSIDSIAISHGFGCQLYEFAEALQVNPNVSDKYKKYKIKFYLSPADIKIRLDNLFYTNILFLLNNSLKN